MEVKFPISVNFCFSIFFLFFSCIYLLTYCPSCHRQLGQHFFFSCIYNHLIWSWFYNRFIFSCVYNHLNQLAVAAAPTLHLQRIKPANNTKRNLHGVTKNSCLSWEGREKLSVSVVLASSPAREFEAGDGPPGVADRCDPRWSDTLIRSGLSSVILDNRSTPERF